MQSKHDFAKAAAMSAAGAKTQGLELSDVVFERTDLIRPNPDNPTFFKVEDEQFFERLREDVQERGIIVPLIVKPDKTLLAGHNRLRVAKELALPKVPVQYVETALTLQQEREFLIKDNLFRRQLSGEEWIGLYRQLFPDFEERIKEKAVGRKPKEEEIPQGDGNSEQSVKPLTAREIAKATGQKERTVQHQLKKHREVTNGASETTHKQKGKSALNADMDADRRFSRAIDEIYVAINDPEFSIWITVESLARTLTKRYQDAVLKQDEKLVKSTLFVKEMEFLFIRLYNLLRNWEETMPSNEQQNEVYRALQKKLDEFQERLTMRQEVE